MAGITSRAYLYLHSERSFHYAGVLKTLDAICTFQEKNPEGALIYSGYEPPSHDVLTREATLNAAKSALVLCPITVAIFRRYDLPIDQCSGLEGRAVGEKAELASEGDDTLGMGNNMDISDLIEIPYDNQPIEMQMTPAFQLAFEDHPKAADLMIRLNITSMEDFRDAWSNLPRQLANAIGLHHYIHICEKSNKDIRKSNIASVSSACIKVAESYPPWCKELDLVSTGMQVRTRNVLWGSQITTFQALAKLKTSELYGLSNIGITSLRNLFNCLTKFSYEGTDPIALPESDGARTKYDNSSRASDTAAAEGSHKLPLPSKEHPVAEGSPSPNSSRYIKAEDIPDISELNGSLLSFVLRALESLEIANESFIDTKAKKRNFDILRMRLQGNTLEECGKVFEVSRERIRQNEKEIITGFNALYTKLLGRLKTASQTGDFAPDGTPWREHYENSLQLAAIQVGLESLTTQEILKEQVPAWLRCLVTDTKALPTSVRKVLFRLLAHLPFMGKRLSGQITCLSHGWHTLDAPREEIILPLGMSTNCIEEQDFIRDTLLPSLANNTYQEAMAAGLAHLRQRGWPVASAILLMECALIYWLPLGETGEVEIPYITTTPRRERQQVFRLLQEAKRPLHIRRDIFNSIRPDEAETHPRPDAQVRNWIGDIQKERISSDPDYPVMIGNSYVATMNQLGLTSEDVEGCAEYIEHLMEQQPDREFSTAELAGALRKAGIPSFSWPDTWPGHERIPMDNIVHVLLVNQRRSHTRNMGRFVWRYGFWTDQPDTENRTQVYDIYKDHFRQERRPLTTKELLDNLKEKRGVGGANQTQVFERNGIIRLEGTGQEALFWDTDLGEWEPEKAKQGRDEEAEHAETSSTTSWKSLAAPIDMTEYKEAYNHFKAHFRRERRPLTAKELLTCWAKEGGAEARIPAQVFEQNGLIHLQGQDENALFWDTDLDRLDSMDIPQVEELHQHLIEWLSRYESVPIDQLPTFFSAFRKLLVPLSMWERAALLARHPKLKIDARESRLVVILAQESEVTYD